VHIRNANGETPLYTAIAGGTDFGIVHFLLEEGGATVDVENEYNETLLQLALERPNEAVAHFFLANASTKDSRRESALFLAIQRTYFEKLAGCQISSNSGEEMVKLLVQGGCGNVEAWDDDGWTPLHVVIAMWNRIGTLTL
jgi:ankyrin repeat protein